MPPHPEPRLTTRQRALLVAGLLAFAATLVLLGRIRTTTGFDDPYITYTYAASLARGDGLTWNGAPVLGTSTPFFAVLLGALERLVPLGVPVWGAVLHWLAAGVAAIALLSLGRREGWPAGAAFAAAALLLQPFVHFHVGSEMLPALAAVLVAAWLLASERWLGAGLGLALAVALRAEAAVAALALAGAYLVRFRSDGRPVARPLARAGGSFVVAIALWSAALYGLAGAIVPTTLAAKRAQAASELRLWVSGVDVFGAAWRDLPRQLLLLDGELALVWIAAALALGAAGLLLSRPGTTPARLALVAWGPLQLGLVAALGVAYYPWYSIPFFFSVSLAAAQLVEGPWMAKVGAALGRRPSSAAGPATAAAAAGAATILLATSSVGWQLHGHEDRRRVAYESVADLARSFPEGTTIAAFEVGYLGHRSRLPVGDLLGLVTAAADLESVRSGRLRENLDRLDPDLLMLPLTAGSLFNSTVGDAASFADQYRLEMLQLGPGTPLVVYRKASLPGNGIVDLLPALRRAGGRPIVRGAGYSVVGARLDAGARAEIAFAEAMPPTSFFAGTITGGPDPAELTLRLARGDGRERRIARLRLTRTAWTRWDRPLPALGRADRLIIECSGPPGSSCDLGAPHLAPRSAPTRRPR